MTWTRFIPAVVSFPHPAPWLRNGKPDEGQGRHEWLLYDD